MDGDEALQRLERGGFFEPAPFSASIQQVTRIPKEIHMGFSLTFIGQAIWFSASITTVDPPRMLAGAKIWVVDEDEGAVEGGGACQLGAGPP